MFEIQPTISFIGGGHMAKSLVSGLVNQNYPSEAIWVCDKHAEKLSQLEQSFGVQTTSHIPEACAAADILVLAVKPQDLKTALISICENLKEQPMLIISIAAGIRTKTITEWMGYPLPIIRAMPNTPALIGSGACGLYATEDVSDKQKTLAQLLLSVSGITVWVDDEAEMDIITALSGSGPAYFFYFMESLVEAATHLGLSPQSAKLLVLQTALGSAKMADDAFDVELSELRTQVTSKGGTTAAGIDVFDTHGFKTLIQQTIQAAAKRAQELGEQL